MSAPRLKLLGPLTRPGDSTGSHRGKRRRVPVAFLAVVVAPTVVSAAYLFMVAQPRYVSEARFIVRSEAGPPSPIGVALQGVGLSSGSTNAFAVHEYMRSRKAIADLGKSINLTKTYRPVGADPFSRIGGVGSIKSFEDLYKGVRRYVHVGYNSTSGISTLRVEAFDPKDAQLVSQRLLDGGEGLINELNVRSQADAVRQAEISLEVATRRLYGAQAQLTAFRNRERFIDPVRTAQAGAELIGELSTRLAVLRAERARIAAEAPQSPQLSMLDGQISAFQRQIDAERARLAGDQDSLAPKISLYENLVMEREFADRMVASATASLNAATLDARRQHLYLDRVVEPNLPDEAEEPRRFRVLAAIFASLLLAYGAGWLILAGLKESKSDI